jgi:hypothetical protein
MKLNSRNLCAAITGAILCGGFITTQNLQASGGATDPIPGTSKSGVNSGGTNSGGGDGTSSNSNKTNNTITSTSTPTTQTSTVTQPIISAPLTFDSPEYTGNYRVDPYYPTLSLMTVNVQANAINVPDNTVLYIAATGSGGTVYPFTNNPIVITGGAGSGSCSAYVTPGTTLRGVVITDASGNVLATGN